MFETQVSLSKVLRLVCCGRREKPWNNDVALVGPPSISAHQSYILSFCLIKDYVEFLLCAHSFRLDSRHQGIEVFLGFLDGFGIVTLYLNCPRISLHWKKIDPHSITHPDFVQVLELIAEHTSWRDVNGAQVLWPRDSDLKQTKSEHGYHSVPKTPTFIRAGSPSCSLGIGPLNCCLFSSSSRSTSS